MNETQDTSENSGGFAEGAAAEKLTVAPQQETIDDIEAERARRLDSDNRPDMAEIDNSDATLPTVEAFNAEQDDSVIGTSDPSEAFRENPPSEAEIAEIEKERERRLADENRPEGAVVDNTGKKAPAEYED